MLGAIIGDIAGSRFEFENTDTKDFTFFHELCRPTDDSIMTMAIAQALLECNGDYTDLSDTAIAWMSQMGKKYRRAGYGHKFSLWIFFPKEMGPYNSWGNGAAMRVSPCAYAARSLEEAKELSRKVTEVSHNHPEGIKGAEAVTVATYMALHGASKEEILKVITEDYYDIDFTLDSLRGHYKFDESCQGSVPQAFEAFFEGKDYEDTIRNAISIGGDSDTIGAIAGALAEAYYGIPEDLRQGGLGYLDDFQKDIVAGFEKKFGVPELR